MGEERPKKAGPFAQIYLPWARRFAESGNVEAAVFMALCTWLYFDEERNAYCSIPREWLVRELELPVLAYDRAKERGKYIDGEKAVESGTKTAKDVIRRLSEKGLIRLVNHPHNGEVAVYQIMPGVPWPLKAQGPGKARGANDSDTDDCSEYD